MSLQNLGVGVQEPRIRVFPDDFDEALSRERHEELLFVSHVAGVEEDEWQEIGTRDMTLTRKNGKWAAFEVFIAANRQQGKGTIIEDRQLAGLFMWDEPLQVYTAHEFKTAQEMFLRIRNRIEASPSLDRLVSRIRTADGEEAIETKSGARLKFMARATNQGRGMTGDVVYLDEAFALKQKTMAALKPTMSARSMDGNPQLIFASSAGMPESEVQNDLRELAVSGKGHRLTYLEWSVPRYDELPADERGRWVDESAYFDDPEVHRRANPAYNIRLAPEFVLSERGSMGDEEFARERLGIWARLGGEAVFPDGVWEALADPKSEPTDRLFVTVDVSPARDSATISVVSLRDDGVVHVEPVKTEAGTDWIGDDLRTMQQKWRPRAVLAIAGSATESLVPEWRRAGVKVRLLKFPQYKQACGVFYDLVVQGKLAHTGDELLTTAVSGAKQQWAQDRSSWYWSRKSSDADITSLVSVTIGVGMLDALRSGVAKKKSERRGVIL